MTPEIKSIFSPDVDDIENPHFEAKEDQYLLLELFIGPQSEDGEELFQVTVCTPEALKERNESKLPRLLRHYLLVDEYDYAEILDLLEKTCSRIREDSWDEVGRKLSRYFLWEFEDYDDN